MDAKSAHRLIEEVCSKTRPAGDETAKSFVERIVRPVGLSLALGLGAAGGLAGCGDAADEYGIPSGDAYGVTDVRVDSRQADSADDVLLPAGDAYGVTDVLPAAGDAYGLSDQ